MIILFIVIGILYVFGFIQTALWIPGQIRQEMLGTNDAFDYAVAFILMIIACIAWPAMVLGKGLGWLGRKWLGFR